MAFCLNPACPQPRNTEEDTICQGCQSPLNQSYLFRVHYRILGLLGEGGFGRTYLAEDTDFYNRRCVIKKLTAKGDEATLAKIKELFAREAQQLKELTHPQIPKLYAYFEQENNLYLVQEFIEGTTLTQEFQQKGPFSQARIQTLLADILPVLEYIQSKDILHRDIKPDNIMWRHGDSKFILIDFGAARVKTGDSPSTLTAIYTPGYAAREHMNGRPTAASDIYSLGATCIRLLTGCLPQGMTDLIYDDFQDCWRWREYLQQQGIIIEGNLAPILDKMLANSLRDRYQSAKEVLQDLAVAPTPPPLNPAQPPNYGQGPVTQPPSYGQGPITQPPNYGQGPITQPPTPPTYIEARANPFTSPPTPPVPKKGVPLIAIIGGGVAAAIAGLVVLFSFSPSSPPDGEVTGPVGTTSPSTQPLVKPPVISPSPATQARTLVGVWETEYTDPESGLPVKIESTLNPDGTFIQKETYTITSINRDFTVTITGTYYVADNFVEYTVQEWSPREFCVDQSNCVPVEPDPTFSFNFQWLDDHTITGENGRISRRIR